MEAIIKIYLIKDPNPNLSIVGQTQKFPTNTLAKIQAFCKQLNKDNPKLNHYLKIDL